MSVACCRRRYRHTNQFAIIHFFDDGNVSEGIIYEYSFCLNIMYAKLRIQNKTLSKINLNYLLITYGLVHIKNIVVITHEIGNMHTACY